jgi:hypothetical protein
MPECNVCTAVGLNGAPWVCPHGIRFNADPSEEAMEAATRYANGRWAPDAPKKRENSMRDFIAGVMWAEREKRD